MMTYWSFYDPATGIFATRKFGGLPQHVAANTPLGLVAMEGDYDHATQRVDLETRQVVAYQRPVSEVDTEQREARRRQAQRSIDELERTQLRPMRELAIDPSNVEAKQRLAEIDNKIAAQRADLSADGGG